MFDKIIAFFQFADGPFGLPAANIVLVALGLVLVFAILTVFLWVKLRGAREILHELGYDPPYGDDAEIIERGNAKTGPLEQRITELEAEAGSKDADRAALQQQIKDREDQLQQAHAETEKAAALAGELAETHRAAIAQLEQRMQEKDAESVSNVAAAEQRWKELADQLQQATLWNDKVTALANDQAQSHRTAVEQLEQHMRDMDAGHIADLTAYQRRTKDLEDRLQQAALQNEHLMAQANEQGQAQQAAVAELEQRIRQMETEGQVYISALERHAKELDDRLQQAVMEKEQIAAQAGEQVQAQQMAVVQLEERIGQMEAEGMAGRAALEERSKELEEQLRQALHLNEQIKTQAVNEAQAHRRTIDQLDQRMREMEAESNANLAALQQRSKELDEQLQRAVIRHDRSVAEANEQMQAYRQTIEKLEMRIRQMEAEGIASMTALDQRSGELEEQLQQAHAQNEKVTAQVAEQTQMHQNAAEQFEQRIRQIESDGVASRSALEQRSRELEEQLRQAHFAHEQIAAQAGEQAQMHQSAVEQLEQRVRQMESDGIASMSALEQRSRELEEQLRQAHFAHEQVAAQAGEQAQTHQNAVEQFEQRLRQIEAENVANLTALRQHSTELEEQLQLANHRSESERLLAQQETLERNHGKEQLEQQIRDLEAERDASATRLKALEALVTALEDQLHQAAAQTEVQQVEAPTATGTASTSEQLLLRAEWITACAVGAVLPHGLVAAEAYASAALAAHPESVDASQLLAELARIRRAYPQGLPSVVEAVTTFEERVAAFFAADLAQTAELADEEAQRRSRAGLNRSALLVANVALQLRQQTDAENSPAIEKLQELRDTLLARLGIDAGKAMGAAKFQSL
jgi:chromosome segregation ATPase